MLAIDDYETGKNYNLGKQDQFRSKIGTVPVLAVPLGSRCEYEINEEPET